MSTGKSADEALLDGLLTRLREDARVLGVARLGAEDRLAVLVATTWDGLESLADELRDLAACVLGEDGVLLVTEGSSLTALDVAGTRLEIELVRMSDLKPAVRGVDARPLLDPRGLLAQWAEWSENRPVEALPVGAETDAVARSVLQMDEAVRILDGLRPGMRIVRQRSAELPLRHVFASRVRAMIDALGDEHPIAAALRERAARALAALPLPGAGVRIVEGGDPGFQRFLAMADGEGFRGDRPLLVSAQARLAGLSGVAPAFEEGFVLPSFDQVEVRFGVGDPVPGSCPALVPGVVVGVGVTAADDLELSAAPFVRGEGAGVACVADDGMRTVLPRSAGGAALETALLSAVDGAWENGPSLHRRARRAEQEVLAAPEDTLRTLHLPRSYVLAAGLHGALDTGVTRLTAALALARAGEDMEPLVARHFGRGAGRLLLAAADTFEAPPPPMPGA